MPHRLRDLYVGYSEGTVGDARTSGAGHLRAVREVISRQEQISFAVINESELSRSA